MPDTDEGFMHPDEAEPAAPLPADAGYPEGPVHYILRRPVTIYVPNAKQEIEAKTITEVWVREPLGDDSVAADKGKTDAEKGLRLLAAICDQPFVFARKLSAWDQGRLGEILARFFPKEG